MRLTPFLATLVIIILLVGIIFVPMLTVAEKSTAKSIEELNAIIDKALVQCYALEGSYPPSLEYLAEHYGLILDNQKYVYVYEPNGMANIKPEFAILPNIYKGGTGK